ncbi:C40 family peptidase [Rubrobacter aplysinae]|uniref:C40 family peptidase n=1 Tax=Rubrobacter aplysinae TaxID=909625 RepID=UPI00128BE977|nr:C40 family peptidase [Rubrobacter aplysinae]
MELAALAPVPVRSGPEPGSELVTELVTGETLVPLQTLEECGGWPGVVVPGHPSSLDERGYPGLVPPDAALVSADGWSPDLTVSRPNRAGLPLGTLLQTKAGETMLPDGGKVELDPDDALPVGASADTTADSARQHSAIGLARAMIGLPYRWGGTDSTAGMDCSGLVFRIMRALGVTVPRDSGDQFYRAPFNRGKSQAGWETARPGDLVFFGERAVTHVGFYLGGGEYISAHGGRQTGCVTVRAMTDDPYQGFARYQ